ncbi:universal stress protein [Actinoplanes sp. NPDC024001]|uniref:universal stress protein n=1 Tax=Actinoplanes sp. NPDC024001 TaxID=3154598 RepID=UPI0033F342C3
MRNTTPQPQESFAGMVVVGVDASAAGGAAVDFAFAFAQEHRLPLAAVHVLTHRERQPEAAVQRLADDVVARQRTYPDVPVVSTVLHGNVAAALIQAGAGAALLVVGDKRRGPLGRVRTGDVVVTVADKAPCPVAVVPADQRSGDPL